MEQKKPSLREPSKSKALTEILSELLSKNRIQAKVTYIDNSGALSEKEIDINAHDLTLDCLLMTTVLDMAINGDKWAIKEIWDRREGTPVQKTVLSASLYNFDHLTPEQKKERLIGAIVDRSTR